MEALIDCFTVGVSVKGSTIPRDSFWNEISNFAAQTDLGKKYHGKSCFDSREEWLFTIFNSLAFNAFQALLQQNKKLEQEKCELLEKYGNLQTKCVSLSCEVKDLSQKLERSASQHSQEESKLKLKFRDLEAKMKKCASIINSTFMDGPIMGQVRDIITQSIPDQEDSKSDYTVSTIKHAKNESKIPKKNRGIKCSTSFNKQLILSADDEDVSILAPSSPDHNDSVDEESIITDIKIIPETVPFNITPKRETKGRSLFKHPRKVLSPLQKSRCNASPTKVASPAKKTTPKTAAFHCENSQDLATFSPPIIADFGSPSRPTFLPQTPKLKKGENSQPGDRSKQDRTLPLKEQQTFQPTPSKKTKALKQTKITSVTTRNASETGARVATKAVRASPCKQEAKRRRKGKDPEDWTCKECYRLFREAEAANKIDVRKMPVTMNFCLEHRNRYTYYLNTPPGFWDCGIGRSPRNGHLHPLDASAIDDDDFVD